ncbi:MAG: TrkA family potassium uptake protein [Oscillospiraceae bacterium]|nr:TrkA family potassium uptake protein [Oscillospiraceae bacterium]
MKRRRRAKSILVIGIGRFGKHIAMNLLRLGNDVMVVDKDEEIIQRISSVFEDVIVGDCTNEDVLRALGISNFDMCFVTIGKNFESSLIITSRLKNLGAKYIVTKAGRDIQTDILKKIGADEVIYPERVLAEKLAVKYNASNIFDYIELTPEFSIYEVAVPADWVGNSIEKIHIRKKYSLNVIAVRAESSLIAMPGADYEFQEGDVIIVIGRQTDVESMCMQD